MISNSILLVSALIIFSFSSTIECRDIRIYNKCPFTTWVGILGPGNPANGGFKLDQGQSRTIRVDDAWTAARIWPRTWCDGNMNCKTGSCGNRVECNGAGGVPPASLAEFTLRGAGGQDFYDVSLVDGYNIPVLIDPIGGRGNCKRAGGCIKDVNMLCPDNLAIKNNGRTVGCKSGCLAYNTDQECCRGAFATPDKCSQSQTAKIFKGACPTAYSYAYDDKTSTFTCTGANYVVQFC